MQPLSHSDDSVITLPYGITAFPITPLASLLAPTLWSLCVHRRSFLWPSASTLSNSHKLCSSICKKNSSLFLWCAINKYASVRLHRLRLLCMNSPSGATERRIYLYIYYICNSVRGSCWCLCFSHLLQSFFLILFSPVVTGIIMLIIRKQSGPCDIDIYI